MPDAKRIKVFHDSDDEEQAVRAQPLTEFSAETLARKETAPLVVPRLENTFRGARQAYVPSALIHATTRTDGRSIEELELEERTRNRAYGLSATNHSGSRTAERDQTASNAPLATARQEASTIHRQAAAESHPDMSSLADYESVPVESFGLAMLRGLGYDPDKDKKAESKPQERRPDFLGLGATQRPEETKTAADLAKKRHEVRKEERTYVPVVKVNKRTGERVLEGAEVFASTSTSPLPVPAPAPARQDELSRLPQKKHDSRPESRSRSLRRHRSRSPDGRHRSKRERDRDRDREDDRRSRHHSNRHRHGSSRRS
ncbi:DExH-box splicing factor binding site-domain-containing protein [Protomyces lactucae-debilis]|uniref:Pre-mRNA-splicing factor n=1 Tax=Protomyces lactucae-debilis TaxID=2754530 RepID=A0A1Y2FXY3_PROLT|nr:DExH-box splicing factor binding site-domain-containing protein [Protomyces lactucae-debilis]ORY87535.1 DExH-box splicing factor binding site-domain-containing protein [Protomyces lactucae-debilis]